MPKRTPKTRNKKQSKVKSSLPLSPAKLLGIAIFALIGVITLVISRADTSNPPILGNQTAPNGYTLKWSDEFNTDNDLSKWNVQNNSKYGSSNNEDQCFKAANTKVYGENLQLIAKRETTTDCGSNPDGGNNYYFTSGMVTTRDQGGPLKYEFKKGYVEARIKIPAGNPFWLGFWLVGGSGAPGWPAYGEMDITELVSARPDLTNGTFHYSRTDNGAHEHTSFSNKYNMALGDNNTCYMCSANYGQQNVLNGAMQEYHRYGLLWEDTRVTWYLDGKPFRSLMADGTLTEYYGAGAVPKTVTKKATAFDVKTFAYNHTIHLTNSVGGNFAKSLGYSGQDSSSGYSNGNLNVLKNPGETATTLVDYVRVYQYDGTSTTNSAPTVNMTNPQDGQAFSNGSTNITLSANATDADGIKSVEFFDGNTSLGVDTTEPYSMVVNAPVGSHSYSAKATDNSTLALATRSSGVNITVSNATPPPTSTTLTVPTNIKASPADQTVTLTWNAVTGANNYTVRWGTGGQFTAYSNDAGEQYNPTTNTYTVKGLTNGTTYNFSVRAKDSTGKYVNSAYSTDVITATPTAPNVSTPNPPTGLSAKPRLSFSNIFSPIKIDVSWTASSSQNIIGYDVSINNKAPVRYTTTKFTQNAKNNYTYTFSVKAVSLTGATSGAATVSTKPSCTWIPLTCKEGL